jgi:hypothetical protein
MLARHLAHAPTKFKPLAPVTRLSRTRYACSILCASWSVVYVTSGLRSSSKWSFVLIIAAILGALGVMALLTPYMLSAALGLVPPLRVLISLLLIAPLRFVLGMPFPKGLRAVGIVAPATVPWAWGANGFLTAIGSVAAVILGMAFGLCWASQRFATLWD